MMKLGNFILLYTVYFYWMHWHHSLHLYTHTHVLSRTYSQFHHFKPRERDTINARACASRHRHHCVEFLQSPRDNDIHASESKVSNRILESCGLFQKEDLIVRTHVCELSSTIWIEYVYPVPTHQIQNSYNSFWKTLMLKNAIKIRYFVCLFNVFDVMRQHSIEASDGELRAIIPNEFSNTYIVCDIIWEGQREREKERNRNRARCDFPHQLIEALEPADDLKFMY